MEQAMPGNVQSTVWLQGNVRIDGVFVKDPVGVPIFRFWNPGDDPGPDSGDDLTPFGKVKKLSVFVVHHFMDGHTAFAKAAAPHRYGFDAMLDWLIE